MDLIVEMAAAAKRRPPGSLPELPLDNEGERKVTAVLRLLERPHWQRAWVRQETGVPSTGLLVLCGSKVSDWHVLNWGIWALWAHGYSRTYDGSHLSDHNLRVLEWTRCSYQTYSSDPLRAQEPGLGHVATNLYDMLRMCRSSLASDPRDYVYSIISLI
jgi:hypothetical protein